MANFLARMTPGYESPLVVTVLFVLCTCVCVCVSVRFLASDVILVDIKEESG